MDIEWLGHASFRWVGEKTIYFDPWKLKTDKKADIILISHDHYDHFDRNDINKISKKETVIITCKAVAASLGPNLRALSPGESTQLNGVKIHAIASYNINKFREPQVPFHPKEKNYLGFIVEASGKKVLHAGDCDNIPELEQAKGVDIALVPASGTYVMTAEEAAASVNDRIKPKLAIPMHWGTIVGTVEDAKKFVQLCQTHSEVPKKVV